MVQAPERERLARQPVAGLQQRNIVGLAVVGDEHVPPLQELGKRREHGGLFVVVAHEEEAHAKAAVLDGPHADKKRASAGTAGQPGGFGVEKSPARGVVRRNPAAGNTAEPLAGQCGQLRDLEAAVPLMAGIETFREKIAAPLVFHHLAVKHLLGVVVFGLLLLEVRKRPGGGLRVPAGSRNGSGGGVHPATLDAPDLPAQTFQVLFKNRFHHAEKK